MQLRIVTVALLLVPAAAWADDRVDTTVTWFQEGREGSQGGLTVIHPQFDVGLDAGKIVSINAGYDADIVTGATMSIYSVDAVSTATTFSDTRHSGHLSLGFRGRRSSLEVGFTHGRERDYRSYVATAGGSVDLPGKNTTFALTYSHNFDFVCDRNNGDATEYERQPLAGQDPCFASGESPTSPTVTKDIAIDTTQASITQNVSPTFVVQFGLHGQIVRGFQSNPYRRVRVAEFDAQESSPLVRSRGALFARGNLALPRLAGAIGFTLRGYSDTWGVSSLSVEADYNQYLGKHLLFRLRGRAYEQTGATFFKDAVDYANSASRRYFTGDRELAPLRTFLAGGRLSYIAVTEEGRPVWGLFDEVSVNLKADAIWSDVLTNTAPGGDVSGTFPEAFILQFGLLLRY